MVSYSLCGHKATLNLNLLPSQSSRSCAKVEAAVPNSPYGLCGRKATLNLNLLPSHSCRSCVEVEVALPK